MNFRYDECYPGGFAEMGGASDEEEDFSKMDPGNKKGVIKRWDFSTEEEFESYQVEFFFYEFNSDLDNY